MTKIDWENITNYIESVGSTDTNFPFKKPQSSVKVTNGGGPNNLIYTIGVQSGTLTPGQSVTVTGSITTMTLRASAGRQAFQVWAVEANTAKEETGNNPSSINIVVNLDGTGDYTNLRYAVESIKDSSSIKVYNIMINEGTYDIMSYYTTTEKADLAFVGLVIPNYVNLIGVGKKRKYHFKR